MFNHRHLEDFFLTFSTCIVIPVIPGNPRAATDNLSNIPALDMSSPAQAISTSKLYHQPVKNHLYQVGTTCPIFTKSPYQMGSKLPNPQVCTNHQLSLLKTHIPQKPQVRTSLPKLFLTKPQ